MGIVIHYVSYIKVPSGGRIGTIWEGVVVGGDEGGGGG